MSTGNPHRNVIGLVGAGPAVEREKHYAWEQGHDYAIFTEGRTITQDDYDAAYDKGYTQGKAKHAEIVRELVGALRGLLGFNAIGPFNPEYQDALDAANDAGANATGV